MARAPRPGAAKTRLEPLLGSDGCARLQAELIRHTIGWATAAARRVAVAFTPADARADLAALCGPGVALFAQSGGDLGERMAAAADRAFTGAPLAVVGTDAPLLASRLAAVGRELAAGRHACVVPALDGGYALLALARPARAAFALPPTTWGGPEVCALTLRALADAGLSTALLDPVDDLDTPADARALAADPRCPAPIRDILSGRDGSSSV